MNRILAGLLVHCLSWKLSFSLRCELLPKPEKAFELLNPLNCSIYVADNRNQQLSPDEFIKWRPSNLWIHNPGGVRYLTFDESCLFSSPGHPNLLKHQIEASEPWGRVDWVYLANGCPGEHGLGGCFPESCSFLLTKDGSLKWSEISKCHLMFVLALFFSLTRAELSAGNGKQTKLSLFSIRLLVINLFCMPHLILRVLPWDGSREHQPTHPAGGSKLTFSKRISSSPLTVMICLRQFVLTEGSPSGNIHAAM
jgi:hypothetical protein